MTEGQDAGGACRLIHLNPKLRAETEQILPALQEAKAPATREEILRILVEHTPQYGITAKMAGQWVTFFGHHLDALEGLPAYAVEDAFLRWNRGEGQTSVEWAKVYPTSAQLFLLAQKGKSELWLATYRAEKALAYHEAKKAPPPEVRKEVGGKLADLLGELKGARKMPDPFAPRVSPQQMAQQIRSQAGEVRDPTAPPADDVGDVL